jgi:TetR/AcrR family transcriptional regulator, ethionamide resistance regulator
MPALSRRTTAAAAAKARSETAFLDATTELLGEGNPYGELGVEAIAQRAGFSRATFYAYFSDKRELLFRLAERAAQDLYAEAGRWLEDGEKDVRPMLASVLELFRAHRSVVGALVESATYDAEVARLWRELHGRFIEIAQDRIRRDHPKLSAENARARAFALVWMTERTCFEHLTAPQVEDDALLDALDLLWRTGLSAR